tara:strand:- start:468 stop:1433 length:966 start_codon:yes stop_codon:yes gene_type:complete
MSGGGGGSSGGGGGDMQVSGMEAAVSKEKGISTHAESKTGAESTSGGSGDHRTGSTGPDTSTVGSVENFRTVDYTDEKGVQRTKPVSGAYTDSEIEKGYTDQGEQLSNVNGTMMTKSQMYSTGVIEKDPNTGQDVQGRYTVNPNTGQFERTDLTFSEHWSNAPDAIKFSPTMRFLYATGKNIGEWSTKKGFKGYNEAGLRGKLGNATTTGDSDGSNSGPNSSNFLGVSGDGERDRMNTIAPHAPYIVSGIAPPSSSPAANWYANLGTTNTNNSNNIGLQYANAKQAVAKTLTNRGSMGMLAVSDSPFYDWLKTKNLDKGIL